MKGVNTRITGKKLKAAEMLANPDFKGSISQLLQECGVSTVKFCGWFADEAFTAHVNKLIQQYTDGLQSQIWKALLERCERGEIQAIKLYFELKGKYKQQTNSENTAPVQIIDDIPKDDDYG